MGLFNKTRKLFERAKHRMSGFKKYTGNNRVFTTHGKNKQAEIYVSQGNKLVFLGIFEDVFNTSSNVVPFNTSFIQDTRNECNVQPNTYRNVIILESDAEEHKNINFDRKKFVDITNKCIKVYTLKLESMREKISDCQVHKGKECSSPEYNNNDFISEMYPNSEIYVKHVDASEINLIKKPTTVEHFKTDELVTNISPSPRKSPSPSKSPSNSIRKEEETRVATTSGGRKTRRFNFKRPKSKKA